MEETFIHGIARELEYHSPQRSMDVLIGCYGPFEGMEFDPETIAARPCLRNFQL